MTNFSLRFIILANILFSSDLLAVIKPDPDDLDELSRGTFLISGASLKQEVNEEKGVMTLCFKSQDWNFDHAALVFEMFLPIKPSEVSLRMLHYSQEDGCCNLGGKKKIMIDSDEEVLMKVHRAWKHSETELNKKEESLPLFTKYASWTISNNKLCQALQDERKEQEDTDNGTKKFPYYYDCVKYVSKVMRNVGLKASFLWWQPETPNNLRLLADNLAPQYTVIDLPQYPYNRPAAKVIDKTSRSQEKEETASFGLYGSNNFLRKENNEIFALYQKAISKDPEACFELGKYMYEEESSRTDGIQDIERYEDAQRYLKVAADKEHIGAKAYLEKIQKISKSLES